MSKIIILLYNYLKQNMKIKINLGHTNQSFKLNDEFVQIKHKNGFNHKTNLSNLKNLSFVPKLIEDNEKESKWEWIDGEIIINPTNDDLWTLGKCINKLHNSKLEFAPFNLKKRVSEYRKIMNDKKIKIEIIEKMYKKINLILKNMYKSTPVHSDLWQQNILKTSNNKIFIVDWEYSHMGDHHFDLAYFIEAYNLNKDQEKIFLDSYEDYNPKLLKLHKAFVHYITILWIHAQPIMPFSDSDSIHKLNKLYEEIK